MSNHSQRIHLAEAFLARLPQALSLPLTTHWDSGWKGEERIIQYSVTVDGDLAGMADVFIEGSPEMELSVFLRMGLTTPDGTQLVARWDHDDLRPMAECLRPVMECPGELSLEIHDEKSLEESIAVLEDYAAGMGEPWMRATANVKNVYREMEIQKQDEKVLDQEKIYLMEREVLLKAATGDFKGALRVFDKQLWPMVAKDGERMVLERWRRLKATIQEFAEEKAEEKKAAKKKKEEQA